MAKKRVHEIAKAQGLSSKELLAALKSAGIEAKAAASSVEEVGRAEGVRCQPGERWLPAAQPREAKAAAERERGPLGRRPKPKADGQTRCGRQRKAGASRQNRPAAEAAQRKNAAS